MTTKERLARLVEALPESEAEGLLETLEERRKARVRAARGSLAHLPGSTEEFMQESRKRLI